MKNPSYRIRVRYRACTSAGAGVAGCSTKCGGLSEGRRLAWMAYDHGVLLVPHGWNTAIGVAADLALTAAMPVAKWVEYQTGVPYIEELIDPPFRLDADGLLPVPTGPGLGITLNPDALDRYGRD